MGIDRGKTLRSAQKHLAKGQLDRAIAEYRRVLEGDPSDARTLLKLGDLLARKGDTGLASETYHRVARQYADEGFFLKAVAVYNQILKLDPNQLQALERLAEMYELLSLSRDALSVYEKVVEALLRRGNMQEALVKLARIVQLDPGNVAVRARYAEALSQAGRTEEAIEAFAAGAKLLKDEGRIDDYLKVTERLLFHQPDNLRLSREMAGLYLERGEPEHALAKLQPCFQAAPTDVYTLELLAGCFIRLGQKAKAISVYKELARVHGEAGRQAERARALRKVVELNPDAVEAKRALAELFGAKAERESPPPPEPAEVSRSSEVPPGLFGSHPPLAVDDPSVLSDLIVVEDVATDGGGARGHDVTSDSAPAPFAALGAFGSPKSAEPSRPTHPRIGSHSTQIGRLMRESEVFTRYGLREKVIANLNEVLNFDPGHVEARKRLRDLYLDAGETMEALTQLLMLAELERENNPTAATGYLREALELDSSNEVARRELQALDGAAARSSAESLLEEPEPDTSQVPRDDGEIVFFEEPEEIGTTEDLEGSDLLELDELAEPADMQARPRPMPIGDEDAEPLLETGLEPMPIGDEDAEPLLETGLEPLAVREEREEIAAGAAAEPTEMAAERVPVPVEPVAGEQEPGRGGLSAEVAEVLEEADFYLAQGMTDEARDTLQEALGSWPEHPILTERLRGLQRAEAKEPRSRTISLAPDSDEEQPDPAQSHFDLGVAYMEMELHDQAVEELQRCLSSPALACAARTMIGLCRVATGRIQEGVEDFKRGLEEPNRTESEELELYFQLGNAYELLDRRGKAFDCFQKVADRDPGFRDVGKRIRHVSMPPEPEPKDELEEFDELFDDMILKD